MTRLQEHSLTNMLEILKHNEEARKLAHSLWEFFDHSIICRRPAIDVNEPNELWIEVERYLCSRKVSDLSPELVIRRNDREEAGLVHELLHLNLILLGFPWFEISPCDDDTMKLAKGIRNNAEHVPMIPIFLSLGYPESEFLRPSQGKYTTRELEVFEDLAKLKPLLLNKRTYGSALSSYLDSRSIKYEVVPLAELMVA